MKRSRSTEAQLFWELFEVLKERADLCGCYGCAKGLAAQRGPRSSCRDPGRGLIEVGSAGTAKAHTERCLLAGVPRQEALAWVVSRGPRFEDGATCAAGRWHGAGEEPFHHGPSLVKDECLGDEARWRFRGKRDRGEPGALGGGLAKASQWEECGHGGQGTSVHSR